MVKKVSILRNYRKLSEIFPNWFIGGGIFVRMANVPWSEFNISLVELDQIYFGVHSGEKIASTLLCKFVGDSSEISTSDSIVVANMLSSYYHTKWLKLFNTMTVEYSPISNYDMTEVEHSTDSNTRDGSIRTSISEDSTISGSEKITKSGSDIEKVENVRKVDASDGVYGYNSSESSPSATSSGTESTTDTKTITPGVVDEHTKESSDKMESSKDDVISDSVIKDGDRTLTRKGNIGVTSSQQLLESERELWMWDYFSVIFSDLDKILTLSIY